MSHVLANIMVDIILVATLQIRKWRVRKIVWWVRGRGKM